ncbi:RNA polymerase sigma factor [Neobacillus sp. LXY-1]|uniref:RNA polymerase sigma factor n=1 Tax=Neobacillus sp. LXY-1 TaxID=3379133 RepID=UPI003EE1D9B4
MDVVQETAYRSFKNINTLKNPEFFKTWLIKIAINCAIELVRKNKKVIELKPHYKEFIGFEDEDISNNLILLKVIFRLNYLIKQFNFINEDTIVYKLYNEQQNEINTVYLLPIELLLK